jgi:hypothetical protein
MERVRRKSARPEEEWRGVRGYEGVYEVSSQGRVRRVGCAQGATPGLVLKPQLHNGYRQVALRQRGGAKTFKIARIVAAAFIDGFTTELEVDHINGCPADDRAINLRSATSTENKRNTKAHHDNRLGVKGVFYDSKNRRFVATISVNHKKIWLGRHRTLQGAASAYSAAAELHFGPFLRGVSSAS